MNANQTTTFTKPKTAPSGSHLLDPDHWLPVTHEAIVGVEPSDSTDQSSIDTQRTDVGAVTPCDPTIVPTKPNTDSSGRTLSNQLPTTGSSTPMLEPSGGWLELRIWAEMFEDAQKARIANTNRANSEGVDPDIYSAHIEALRRTEHECRLALRRCYRRITPPQIVEWQKNTIGIGPDMFARLLGHLGHPVWTTPHHWHNGPPPPDHACLERVCGPTRHLIAGPPFARTIGQLWQFCGHGAPSRKTKGMSAADLAAQGNPKLKMLVHLNAEMCMKQRTSPFRLVYDQTRIAVADKLHTQECVRCGPSGKPAQPGTPWKLGHQHAHALRITGKEILRDLWTVASLGGDT